LSIVLIVFSKLNNAIPFVSDDLKEDAVLYEPVKNLAPTLFPNFLKVVEEETDLDISE
jgi:membrane protein required for colicin V production